jgi:hypothetical protein
MSTSPQSFQFVDSSSASKTGQTLPIGAQAGATSVSSVPASDLANIEPGGTPITGASMPAGGVGMTGWLSAIWSELSGTLAVSAAALPLPTGAALDTSVQQVKTALGSPFQAGGSISNTTFASTQSGQWNITNISGTISLPTGAATSALQPALNGDGGALAHITNLPATQAISAASLPLPSGAATSALQTTGNTSLASIVTALGSPLQAGGSIGNTAFGVSSLPALAAGSNIIGYAGSLNFQTAPVVPTIQAAAYASGNVIGGKLTVANVFRNTTQPSATLSQFLLGWAGAETVVVTVYLFSRNPTSGTYTDKTAMTLAAADAQYLVTAPFTITAAASAGTTQTFAAQSLSLSVQNRDSSVTQNLYAVLVVGGAVTPAVGDLFFSISGVLD